MILNDLTGITSRFNTYFHYTITAYGKDIEPGVPDIEKSMETLKKLSAMVGKQRIAWRYDPVLLTERYTIHSHMETFERMAKEKAFENYKYHDPDSPLLLGHLKETDTVSQGLQKTFQKRNSRI